MKLISRVVALLLLALAMPALAAGPIIIDNPLPTFSIPANVGCSFVVNAAPEEGKPNGGQLITFTDGSQIGAGPTFVTLTNVSNNKSINLNISGPARTIITSNGTTLVNLGLTLAIGFTAPAPPEIQGLVLASGRLVQQFDNSGTRTSITFTGTTTNLCQSLE